MITSCERCGAPLHNGRCEYCGADYREKIPQITYTIEPDYGYETISCRSSIPLNYVKGMDEKEIAEVVKRDMAAEISRKLCDYMDVETWVEPTTLMQVFGGRIRVKRPSF